MNREVILFFQAACAGGVLLLCYDILVVFRRVMPHCKAVMAVQDVLFWVLAGFVLFAGIYRGNEGKLRNFLFLGSFLGFCLCRVTISPIFVAAFVKILGLAVFLAEKTVKRLLFPVKRCKIFLKNITLSKRLKQIEKKQKKKK